MLRKETVTAPTLELLRDLMRDKHLSEFFLVGGTAVSLQIGHRISIDIDLFSQNPFDESKMLTYLEKDKGFQLDYLDKNTAKGQIAGVKIDLITHSYPIVNKLEEIDGIRMASLDDIAAMKFNAIVGNGTRVKNFIDVAFLSCYLSLKRMTQAYEQKYSSRNPFVIIKALSYHKDIDFGEPVQMISKKYSWKLIQKRLQEMEKFPLKIFPISPVL